MNRTQMIERIAEHTGIEKKTVAGVLGGLNEVVLASVAKGDSIMLPGIAKFTKVKRKARMGRNPATGAPVKIPAKTVAKVTALKLYKDTVLGATPAPKLQKTGITKPAPKTTRATKATAATTAAAKPPVARATRATAAKSAAGTAAKTTGTRGTRSSAAKTTAPATKPAATRSTGRVAAAKSTGAATSAASGPSVRATRSATTKPTGAKATATRTTAKPRPTRSKN